jgi:hypothetical protein
LLSFDNCASAAAANSAPRPPEIFIIVRFVSKLSAEQWAEARRMRMQGTPFKTLAQRFGISQKALRTLSSRHGWPSPQATVHAGSALNPVSYGSRLPQSTNHVRRLLARRLFRILDIELTLMELRMKKSLDEADASGKASAAGSSKPVGVGAVDVPRLESIIKTINSVTELEADTDPRSRSGAKLADGGKSQSGAAGHATPSEADVFRREIAERVEKLIPPA